MPDRDWWLNVECQDKLEARAVLVLLEQTMPHGSDFRMRWNRPDIVVIDFAMPAAHEVLLRLKPKKKCLHVDFAIGPGSGRREQGLRLPLERLSRFGYNTGRKKGSDERYFIDLTTKPLNTEPGEFWAFAQTAGEEKRLHS